MKQQTPFGYIWTPPTVSEDDLKIPLRIKTFISNKRANLTFAKSSSISAGKMVYSPVLHQRQSTNWLKTKTNAGMTKNVYHVYNAFFFLYIYTNDLEVNHGS